MSALCQLSDVKTYAGIADTNQDAVIGALIPQASAFIESYCNRAFASQAYTETRSGNGKDRLYAANAPLTAVTAVTVDGLTQTPAPDTVSDGYVFDSDVIYIRGGCFTKGIQNVSLSYTAGYTTTPPDVVQACVELIIYKIAKRNRIDKKNEVLAQQTVGFDMSDMPAQVKSALGNYVRWGASP